MNRLKRYLLCCTVMIVAQGTLYPQVSYDNWNFSIRAQNAAQTDSIASLGIRVGATSDFDNLYDIPRPPRPPSGTYLELYFPHSGGSYPPVLGSKYASDYQGPSDPVWDLSLESSVAGTLTIFWDSAYVSQVEARLQLFLLDLSTGALTDMRASGRYTFAYAAKRDFRIVGGVKINLRYLMEGFWNGSSQVRDTVSAYLAEPVPPFSFIDSTKSFLSSSGTGQLIFNHAPTGSYYLVLRHRNHIEIWTAASLGLTSGTTSFAQYDFASGSGSAFGTEALKASGGLFVAWGGDVNQDGLVDYRDRNVTWNNREAGGRLSTDCNGDGLTDAVDYLMVLDNRYKIRQKP